MRAPLTPIKAYVVDAARLGPVGETPAADDPRLSQWFLVAQAAERLAELKSDQRKEYVTVLRSSVLPFRADRPTQIEGDGRAPTDALDVLAERLRLEAEEMERAGCFELALTTVSSVCQMLARGSLTARLLATAHLGRVARQMGELTAAVDCYTTVTTEGQKAKDGPLAAHGFVGLGIVANAHGNRPSQKAFFLKALDLAAKGSPVELSAHQGLMVTANQLGDLADALLHGWRVHDLAVPNSEVQFETINNLANTALNAGFHSAASSGFDYVIQRTTLSRLRLPAIGGGIQSAAELGRRELVDALEELGRKEVRASALPHEAATFFFKAAQARSLLGDLPAVSPLIARSLELAEQFGFHELRLKAEDLIAFIERSAGQRSVPPTVFSDTKRAVPWVESDADDVVQVGIGRLTALAEV